MLGLGLVRKAFTRLASIINAYADTLETSLPSLSIDVNPDRLLPGPSTAEALETPQEQPEARPSRRRS